MKLFLTTFLYLILSFSSYSQSANTYILKTSRFLSIEQLRRAIKINKSDNLRVIFKELNLYSLELSDENQENIARIKNNSLVEFIEKDEPIELRKVPNDINFSEQYALEQIKATELWDYTTGGLTHDADTIVIAVFDEGCDIFHDDLFDNIWRNKGEIPNDSIDNDDNGYIDDYFGVNILNKNGKHMPKNHGTSVAGIIGAIGNNSIGISGVNWNVKILPITDILSKKRIIEGYSYAYRLRKKYNETNGKEGAFIVCVNFSGGTLTPQFPEDSKLNMNWCEMYNKLGEVGIISVVSTDNVPRNVDEEGDMPTLCQSQYLLTVTSTEENDKFDNHRAYSKNNVDIAAPGNNIFSIAESTGAGTGIDTSFTGNSAAAPHVAGAIGLLYTIPCDGFIDELHENPSEMGLKIKKFILDYSDKHDDLLEKTVSGGRLNVMETYAYLLDNTCKELKYREFNISKIYPNPANSIVNIKFETNNYNNHKIIIFNNLGQLVYREIFRPKPYDNEVKKIDVSMFPKGIYYFSLISKQEVITKQIMVY